MAISAVGNQVNSSVPVHNQKPQPRPQQQVQAAIAKDHDADDVKGMRTNTIDIKA